MGILGNFAFWAGLGIGTFVGVFVMGLMQMSAMDAMQAEREQERMKAKEGQRNASDVH